MSLGGAETFDAALVVGNSISMNLIFPGQYWDEEAGNNYNLYRNYNPSIGRYLESDPASLAGGLNLYVYADGNPLINLDSNGLVRWHAQTLGGERGFWTVYTAGGDLMGFTSTCRNGRSCVVYVVVGTVGVGVGRPISFSADLRGTAYIDRFDEPKPSSLAGPAVKLGCQAVLGRSLGAAMLHW